MLERYSLPGEQWAVVPSDGRYEVSTEGRVWSRPRFKVRGGMLATWPDAKGYATVKLDARTHHVHRLVALAFLGPCPDGLEVRHLDGDATNPRLDNLAYGTREENRRDRQRHGTDHNANKTHCPQGHPYDEENTYVAPSRPDARYCVRCTRERTLDYMRRKRAQGEPDLLA